MSEGTTLGVLEGLWEEMADHQTENSFFNRERIELAIRLGHFAEAERRLAELRRGSTTSWFIGKLMLENYRMGLGEIVTIHQSVPELDPDELPWLEWKPFVETSFHLAKLSGLANADVVEPADALLSAYRPVLESQLLTVSVLPTTVDPTDAPPYFSALSGAGQSDDKPNVWAPVANFRRLSVYDIVGDPAGFRRLYLETMQEIARRYTAALPDYEMLWYNLSAIDAGSFSQSFFNAYNLIVSDVSYPSDWPIASVDVIDFLLASHGGSLQPAVNTFFPVHPTPIDPGSPAPSAGSQPAETGNLVEQLDLAKLLIKDDNIEGALSQLQGLSTAQDFQTTLTLLDQQNSSLRQLIETGQIRHHDAQARKARIVRGLLDAAEGLEEGQME